MLGKIKCFVSVYPVVGDEDDLDYPPQIVKVFLHHHLRTKGRCYLPRGCWFDLEEEGIPREVDIGLLLMVVVSVCPTKGEEEAEGEN